MPKVKTKGSLEVLKKCALSPSHSCRSQKFQVIPRNVSWYRATDDDKDWFSSYHSRSHVDQFSYRASFGGKC